MVMVEKKDGSIRLCIDPVDLNKSIKRPHYPIPTLDDVTSKLHGAKVFTKLDARSGYWSILLSDDSSYLMTFSTIYGRYRFKRMPFGIISAQDEFQRRMEDAFEGLEGFEIIIDDMIVYGNTQEEHDERLAAILERALVKGIRFNEEKCEFSVSRVKYFGHVISSEGMQPDPDKIRAINNMPSPSCREELQTLLGMINYLAKYIPSLSTKNKKLRDLTKADPFIWEEEHTQILEDLKSSIVSNTPFFNHKSNNVELIVDASSHGLGAHLVSEGKVTAYASRSLSKTEQKYSQLEKELYAIVFGCKHFHHYLYGRHVEVTTDHRPLETVVANPIHKAPPRVQRLMLQLQPYDLSLKLRPGSEIPVADALSRLHLGDADPTLEESLDVYVHQVVRNLPAKKVVTPTEWVNSMVMVEKKDGSIRLCIDPVDLNKSIKRPHYPIPTLDDVTSKLHGAKVFTKLDARSGYWSILLSDDSSYLMTFSTIYGRYRFKRMPFGIISAQDEFQRRMEDAFEGLEGFEIIIDDMIVYGNTQEEHDERLAAILERALVKGIRFNEEKCEFSVSRVKYFGHVISSEGMQPDPDKIRAINNMPSPSCREELQTLLGMINYLAKYIPSLSTKNKKLRDLTKADPFIWEEEHTQILEDLKSSIVSNTPFFNHKSNNVELIVDASSHGLGAHLVSEGKVTAYASRSLSKTEQKYSQLEKELYAIVFGCKHFHHYLYGRHVEVTTDHRPLETVVANPIHKAPPRVQRLMLQLQPYDLSLKFRPGSEIPVADALSRLHLGDADPTLEESLDVYVHQVVRNLPAKKVVTPTEWVNSMVMVEKKDGSIRLCIDPVDLNKSIKRPHYPIPTLDDVTSKLHGAKVFTKLDARSGYWSILLSDDSSYLMTFSTIYGRYRFKRMPFGIISAQDEFQRRMEDAFEGLEGFEIIIDDMIVYGNTQEEHDERLAAILERALVKGIRFNEEKCEFSVSRVKYFGHVISSEGMQPDPDKIRAINNMPSPSCREELQTLLGMINYLAKYIPSLSTKNKKLRDLTKADPFIWEEEHTQILEDLKSSIVSNTPFFNHKSNNVELIVDASSHGLGAHLVSEGKVTAYASRSLSKTEQKYSQLEKELYAIVFGCKHFHHYLYGRHVEVTTDHRPLETVVANPIHKAPPRVQRLMLQLQPYDLSLKFRPGSEIPVADALSRLHLGDADPTLEESLDVYVHQVLIEKFTKGDDTNTGANIFH
ncbi:hypothetical protein QYM36_001408 [Artemia franciscana]|uniref:Reverse transcriptase domain-containing protein n=1 Tax=Artemia franciscana TaxID=6661 RepID=A0AA88I997_ARTSF|nr:hypothetical protein QYM36_001408 [Artemia franciscana]